MRNGRIRLQTDDPGTGETQDPYRCIRGITTQKDKGVTMAEPKEFTTSFLTEEEHELSISRFLDGLEWVLSGQVPEEGKDDPLKQVRGAAEKVYGAMNADPEVYEEASLELMESCAVYIRMADENEADEEKKRELSQIRAMYEALKREQIYGERGLEQPETVAETGEKTQQKSEEEAGKEALEDAADQEEKRKEIAAAGEQQEKIEELGTMLREARPELKDFIVRMIDIDGKEGVKPEREKLYSALLAVSELEETRSPEEILNALGGVINSADEYYAKYTQVKDTDPSYTQEGAELAQNIAKYAEKLKGRAAELSGGLKIDEPVKEQQEKTDLKIAELGGLKNTMDKETIRQDNRIYRGVHQEGVAVRIEGWGKENWFYESSGGKRKKTDLKTLQKEEDLANGKKEKPDYKSLRQSRGPELSFAAEKKNDVMKNDTAITPRKK